MSGSLLLVGGRLVTAEVDVADVHQHGGGGGSYDRRPTDVALPDGGARAER